MTRISIHIGVNRVDSSHYGGTFPVLRAAENDAVAMQQKLQPLGYNEQIPLIGPAATTTNFFTQVRRFARNGTNRLSAGDLLVVTYSGHGSRVVDPFSQEPDQLNEVFVFRDRFLIDNEMRRLFAELASGVQVVIIADSCHSGTVLELDLISNLAVADVANKSLEVHPPFRYPPADSSQSRLVDWQVAMTVVGNNPTIYKPIVQQPPLPEAALQATTLSLSACNDGQEAHEMPNGQNGWFTFYLLGLFQSGMPLTYPALRQRLETLTRTNNQIPQLNTYGPNKPLLENRSPFL